MKIKFILSIHLIALSFSLNAQLGGQQVYQFLDLAPSARIMALGEYSISIVDDDANLAFQNPALLNNSSHTQLNFNQNFHFQDIVNGYFSYASKIDKWGINVHTGLQYISYGNFTQADEFGNTSGNFSASELAFVFGASKWLNERFSLGSNLKIISSNFESYRSYGMAIDIGGSYYNPEKRSSIGLVIRNMGLQLRSYTENRENLPFDLMLGYSKQLEHLPFRFSVIAHHLHQWDITYDDPTLENEVLFSNNFVSNLDNLFRHIVLNGEFLIGKGAPLKLRFGYNHLRRRELNVSEFRSFGGFSTGVGIKTRKWRVDYGLAIYHLAGSVHHLSFGTSLNTFKKKKEL